MHKQLASCAALLAAASISCIAPSATGPVCTKRGADSGVILTWNPGAETPDLAPGSRYELCARGTCDTRTADPTEETGVMLRVVLPEDVGPVEAGVTFTVTEPGAKRPVVDERLTVELTKFQPNGDDCPPTVHSAALTYTEAGGLAVTTRDRSGR